MSNLSLSELCDAIVDCEHKTANTQSSGIPSIRTTNIKNGRIDFKNANRVSFAVYKEWTARLEPQPNDLILAREAPVGEVGIIPFNQKACLGQRTVLIRPNQQRIYPKYLLYLLLTPEMRYEMNRRAEGSTVPHLNMLDIRNLAIPKLPPLPEQKAIAHILGTLDDKMELNQQMNQTLEAMAKAIFKSWFVDFEPVRAKMEGRQPVGMDAATAELFPDSFEESALGMIPKGWEVKELGNLAQNFSKTFDFSQHESVIFINTGDVLSGKFLHSNLVSKDGLPGQAKKSIDKNDILLSEIRPANQRYAFVDFDANNYVVSTKFMIIRAFEMIETRLLYRILTSQSSLAEFQIVAESRSGTFPQITFDSISYFPIILAAKSIQISFLNLISPLEKQIKQNNLQSETFANIRDTLLPKLMSGEIRVKEAEKLLDAVV